MREKKKRKRSADDPVIKEALSDTLVVETREVFNVPLDKVRVRVHKKEKLEEKEELKDSIAMTKKETKEVTPPVVAVHSERKHYDIGGSTFERREECEGSLLMERGRPNPTSEQAAEGTLFHELLDTIGALLSKEYNKTRNLPKYKSLLAQIPNINDWSGDMHTHAKDFFKHMYAEITELNPKKVFPERVFTFREVEPQMGGPADFFFVFEKENSKGQKELWLFIADEKYGSGKLILADSRQLLFYAAACASEFSHKYQFAGVICAIHQPRLEDEEGEIYRKVTYTGEELYKFIETAEEVHQKSYAVKTKDVALTKLKYGSHCHFCRAALVCPEYIKREEENAVLAFSDVEITWEETNSDEETALALVHMLDTNEKIGRFLRYAPILSDVINKVRALALHKILEEDEEIPGWKVVQGKSRRQWPERGVDDVAKQLKAWGVEEPFQYKLKGITAIETELTDIVLEKVIQMSETGKLKRGDKTKARNLVKDHLKEVTVRSIPGNNLAPIEDPRPGVDMITDKTGAFEEIDMDFDEL